MNRVGITFLLLFIVTAYATLSFSADEPVLYFGKLKDYQGGDTAIFDNSAGTNILLNVTEDSKERLEYKINKTNLRKDDYVCMVVRGSDLLSVTDGRREITTQQFIDIQKQIKSKADNMKQSAANDLLTKSKAAPSEGAIYTEAWKMIAKEYWLKPTPENECVLRYLYRMHLFKNNLEHEI